MKAPCHPAAGELAWPALATNPDRTELVKAVQAIEDSGGQVAKILRTACGRRQNDVETELGLARGRLSKLESGQLRWSLGLVELLLEELGMGTEDVDLAARLYRRRGGRARREA